MIRTRGILLFIGLALAATPALAGGDKHEGQIDVHSVGWGAAHAPQAGNNEGGYVLTGVQHTAKPSSSLGSLRSLGSSADLFANSRGGDQGAPIARGPSGTGKTMSAALLGKTEGPAAGSQQPAPSGSITDLVVDPRNRARPTGTVPTGTVVFKVDGVSQAGGGAAKGPATLRK